MPQDSCDSVTSLKHGFQINITLRPFCTFCWILPKQLLTILIETLPYYTPTSVSRKATGGEGPEWTLAGVCWCPQGPLGPKGRTSGPFQQFICKFSHLDVLSVQCQTSD